MRAFQIAYQKLTLFIEVKKELMYMEKRKRVLSGVQPSGTLHIGNYLGAIRNWVEEQDQYENFFCVVNLHSITVPQDPATLPEKTRQVAALYLACGISEEKSHVFAQSEVSPHAELAWILNCVTPLGWLNRMTQFKSKAGDEQELASVGLYDYPVLMAADILLYQAHYVPVGEDQRQHIELTRDIAGRFNNLYGEAFVIPEALIKDTGARVMSLVDPLKKMSKSDQPGSYIALLDSPEEIRKKISRATTDSQREIVFDQSRPAIYNLITMYEILTGSSRTAIEHEFEGKGYKEFKAALADAVIAALEPIQKRYNKIMQEPGYIDAILQSGAEKARSVANVTLKDVQEKIGLAIR